MIAVRIRCPDDGETPLSYDERLVAIREGFHACDTPRWHPAIVKKFSVMSARMHRDAAVREVAKAAW